MMITPVTSEVAASSLQQILGVSTPNNTHDVFDKLFAQIDGLNTQLITADQSVQKLASGETENLHQVVMSLQQTRLAFDLMLQVRNKVLDAYQEVMRMQV